MKELFVSKPKNDIQGRASKIYNSKEIKIRRYSKYFYKHNVMELYTLLNFYSVKYGFDIKMLLELLLENLYNGDKIDSFVFQMTLMEEKEEIPLLYYVIQRIVLKQYMTSKKITQEIRISVFKDLISFSDMEVGMKVLNWKNWRLGFLSIKKDRVLFYTKKMITTKLEKILSGMYFVEKPPIFFEFLNYLKERQFLHDTKTDKQIEEILSRYYLVHRKNML